MWLFKKLEEKIDENVLHNTDTKDISIQKITSIPMDEETKQVNTSESLKQRVDNGKIIFSKFENLKNKTLNNNTNTSIVEHVENQEDKLLSAYEELNRNFESNSRRLKDILFALPILQKQLQNVCQKVDRISDVLDTQTTNTKNMQEDINRVTDFPPSNSTKDLNPSSSNVSLPPSPNRTRQSSRNLVGFKNASGSRNKMLMVEKKSLKKKETVIGKFSQVNKNKKFSKDKRLLLKENKTSDQESTETESVTEMDCAVINETSTQENHSDSVMNNRHKMESEELAQSVVFASLECILNNLKISQETGKNDILDNISKLEEKVNTCNNSLNSLVCDLERKTSINLGENSQETGKNEILDKISKLEEKINICNNTLNLLMCDLERKTSIGLSEKSQETGKNEILDKISKLEGKFNSYNNTLDSLMYNLERKTSIGLDENSKLTQTRSNVEMKKNQCSQTKQVTVEEFNPSQNDTKNIQSIANTTSKDNDNNKSNNNIMRDSDRCVCKSIMNEKTNSKVNNSHSNTDKLNYDHINLCEFFKSESNLERIKKFIHCNKTDKNIKKEVDEFTKPKTEKNQICDSQPIPERLNPIKQNRESSLLENQCKKVTKIPDELSRSPKNVDKLFSVEKIMNDNCDDKETVYKITQENHTQGIQLRNRNSSCLRYFNQ